MKKIYLSLLGCFALCIFGFSIGVAAEPASLATWEPKILALSGAPYPQARVVAVNAAEGTLVFEWLDGAGKRVDSGGSVARFTVLDPVAYPADAALAAAIATPPPETLEQFVARAISAVQSMLDARARQDGYDNILSAASYAGTTGGRFAAEGAAYKTWRSAVWAACYDALGAHDPQAPPPNLATFLASLPAYVPPAP